jgi:hypothetical protein
MRQTVAVRAYYATRWLWSRGIYPGVAAVSLRMHGHVRDLNDRETDGRRKAMQQLGIPFQRTGLSAHCHAHATPPPLASLTPSAHTR